MADGSAARADYAQAEQVQLEKSLALPQVPGFIQAFPIMMGYLPVSFAFGLVASQAKISLLSTFLMSFLVYAGCSQFVAVGMLVAGASVLPVVLTTLIINFRHFLLSMAIAPHFKGWSKLKCSLFGLQMTDETFLVQSATFSSGRNDEATVFGINILAHTAWITGTVLGYNFASKMGDISVFGFDYALPAMFICLLTLQLVSRLLLMVAMVCVIFLVGFKTLGMGAWSPILATLVAATFGTWFSACATRS